MCEWKQFPTCPYCGREDQDWWDGLGEDKNDGGEWIVDCPFCDKKYKIAMCVETSFSTEEVKDEPENQEKNRLLTKQDSDFKG